MRMKRSFISSLVLHGILFFFALIVFRGKSSPFQSKLTSPIVMEVSNPESSSSYQGNQGKSASRKKSSRALPRLKDLGVFSESGVPKTSSSGGVHEGEPASPFGFENQVTGKSSPVLTYLFRKIDGAFGYPQEFRNAKISGEVTAKLQFDEHGSWINSPSDVRGNGYLRVYLLQRLRKCFAEPIPEKIWKADPHSLSIDAHFIFDIVAPETVVGAQVGPQYAPSANPTKFNTTDMDGGQSIERQIVAGKQGMYGRKFQFYRVFLSSPFDWKFGPFAGYGVMPAVGIDPGWFVDTVKNIIHPKVKIDPLEHYRDDSDW